LALPMLFALLPAIAQEPPAADPLPAAEQATEPAPPPGPAVGEANRQISDRLPVEQQLWLEANGVRFFARWLPALAGAPRGGVLILHDAGQHPSWPLTVAALFDSL